MVVSARWTRAIHLELLEVQRQRTGNIPNMQEHTYLPSYEPQKDSSTRLSCGRGSAFCLLLPTYLPKVLILNVR